MQSRWDPMSSGKGELNVWGDTVGVVTRQRKLDVKKELLIMSVQGVYPTKNETMAPFHVATLTVQRELPYALFLKSHQLTLVCLSPPPPPMCAQGEQDLLQSSLAGE